MIEPLCCFDQDGNFIVNPEYAKSPKNREKPDLVISKHLEALSRYKKDYSIIDTNVEKESNVKTAFGCKAIVNPENTKISTDIDNRFLFEVGNNTAKKSNVEEDSEKVTISDPAAESKDSSTSNTKRPSVEEDSETSSNSKATTNSDIVDPDTAKCSVVTKEWTSADKSIKIKLKIKACEIKNIDINFDIDTCDDGFHLKLKK